MIVLGLDLSTHTGWAVLNDGQLIDYGRYDAHDLHFEGCVDDFRLLSKAKAIVSNVMGLIFQYQPDIIAIEQTNAGSFRTAQKQLEILHGLLLDQFFPINEWSKRIQYVDTSAWRSKLGIKLTKEQRLHNKAVKSGKVRGKLTPKHLAVAWANEKFNLKLKLCENDIADALALSFYGYVSNQEKAQAKPVNLDEVFA